MSSSYKLFDTSLVIEFKSSNSSETDEPRNQVWEQLNRYVFFKRTSAYFIIEASLLKVYFVSKQNKKFKFELILKTNRNNKTSNGIYLDNATYQLKESRSSYELNLLYCELNLLTYLNYASYEDLLNDRLLKLDLYIRDANNPSQSTQFPIRVTAKYIKHKSLKKEGSIVCSKCYFFQPNEHQFLKWWIELNKQIGYKKVVFCNNSIPNTREFNAIFDEYKDFVGLKQFHSFPNFDDPWVMRSDQKHNYFSEYYQLKLSNQFELFFRDGYDVLHTNECFLENADKYQFVTVIDNDETILPFINKQIFSYKDSYDFILNLNKTSRLSLSLECEVDNDKKVDWYLHKFSFKSNFYFKMAYYLKNKIIKKIFDSFEAYFNSNQFKLNRKSQHIIHVIDLEPNSKTHNAFNYSFIIENRNELKYAQNMLLAYRLFIEKFENEHEVVLNKYSENFHRYFFISGRSSEWLYGKSVWHTDHTLEYSVHEGVVAEQPIYVDFDYGHNAHFRETYPFNDPNISINEFKLDLNYLNCVYKPIIYRLAQLNIF
jgi:hypothetical protein